MKLSEVTREAIRLAEAIRRYWAKELPKRHPNFPEVNLGEDSGPPPPEEKQLERLLKKLPDDILYRVALIMYLGRGDFGVEDLAERYETLKETLEKPEWAISQMLEKAPLADYLSDGLDVLKHHRIDADRMPVGTASKSRK